MVNDLVMLPAALVALTVKVKVPAVLGVPVILPSADSVRPLGRLPDSLFQVIVGSPVATKV